MRSKIENDLSILVGESTYMVININTWKSSLKKLFTYVQR